VKKHFLLIWLLACAAAQAQGLSISVRDVGLGDAALMRANGRNVLIDAGPSPTRVADWLRRAKVDTHDLAIASHNHADHIGGMPRVLETIPVRNYMENGMPATTRTYGRIVTLLEERGITVLRATPRTIDLGDGVTLRVLSSAPDSRSQNDASIGLELSYGSFHALFTGDAEGRQRAFWSRDSVGRVQVLKVSHHGSVNGTDRAWLAALHPCVAVISVGAKNSFYHPSRLVERLLD
jgi:beta-lactamase superfamily II metal-dependent hydrolase